jgi:hypothetical protein
LCKARPLDVAFAPFDSHDLRATRRELDCVQTLETAEIEHAKLVHGFRDQIVDRLDDAPDAVLVAVDTRSSRVHPFPEMDVVCCPRPEALRNRFFLALEWRARLLVRLRLGHDPRRSLVRNNGPLLASPREIHPSPKTVSSTFAMRLAR